MDEKFLDDLRTAYDAKAVDRDVANPAPWKIQERSQFLAELQREGKTRLLELGSGPGRDGQFFRDSGLSVVCTDLSAAMAELCREKGLEAHVMDFLHLDFPAQSFDAVFAMTCLLHVPGASLPAVLRSINRVLRPGGLFYMGVYGGHNAEGPMPDDDYQPKRFFAYYEDHQIIKVLSAVFDLVYFRAVNLPKAGHPHFQSIILRSRAV